MTGIHTHPLPFSFLLKPTNECDDGDGNVPRPLRSGSSLPIWPLWSPCLVWLPPTSVLFLYLLWLFDALDELLPSHFFPSTLNLQLIGVFTCSPNNQPHLRWQLEAGPRRGVTSAVTSARCVSAGGGRRESLARAWGSGGGRDRGVGPRRTFCCGCCGGRGWDVDRDGECWTRRTRRRDPPEL